MTVNASPPRLIASDLDGTLLRRQRGLGLRRHAERSAMLAWAGVAFAVANAHPEVLAAARHVCPSNADDGVACVLESLITRLDPPG